VRRSNVAAIQHRTRLLEEKAQTIEAFQPSTVVGLVQSKAFVRAVFGQPQVADAEQAISERLARQRQIVGSDKQVTIIPWTQPLSRPLMSGFRPFDRTVLAVSSEIGEVFIEDPTDLAEMSALFDQLTEWADFGEAAAEIARRFAAGYRSRQPRGSVQYNHRVGLVKGVEEHPARDPVLRWRTGRVAGRISHTASQTALGSEM
jgi:hypothetical protein